MNPKENNLTSQFTHTNTAGSSDQVSYQKKPSKVWKSSFQQLYPSIEEISHLEPVIEIQSSKPGNGDYYSSGSLSSIKQQARSSLLLD